jgi:Zn-dependent peptidase ImmA (M78 family)
MLPIPFISDEKIELRMEAEVRSSGLWSTDSDAVFEVEDFLEKHLKAILDVDATLADEVMGEVTFRSGKRPCVKINADLSYDAEHSNKLGSLGRWRMTVVHEGAHIILHEPYFVSTAGQTSLWDDDEPQVHRCYKHNLEAMGVRDLASPDNSICNLSWNSGRLLNESEQTARMEIQANRAAAALLMPRFAFLPAAIEAFDAVNQRLNNLSDSARQQAVVAQLAQRFVVSQQAARIRCHQLGVLERAGQSKLL